MSWLIPDGYQPPGHSCDPPFTLPPIIEEGDVWKCDFCMQEWYVFKINDNRTADYVQVREQDPNG